MAAGMTDVIGPQVSELFVAEGQEGVRRLCKQLDGNVLYLPMVITPELAQLFESMQTDRQRNANELSVDSYKRDIDHDRWLETGEGFKFDTLGRLVDGGHRIKSVIASGKSIRSLVVFGVQPEAALVIDSGRARTTANTLKFAGSGTYTQELAGAIPRLHAAELGKWVKPSRYIKLSREEIIGYLTEHPELPDLMADAKRRTHGAVRIPRATTTAVGLVEAILYRTPPYLHPEVTEFLEAVTTGAGLRSDSAVLVLRETLSRGAPPQWRRASRTSESGGFTIDETMALFFTAWNRRNEPRVRKLTIPLPLNDENFPRPKNVRLTVPAGAAALVKEQ